MKITKALVLEEKLAVWMRSVPGVLVAFSGGVDSSYLAVLARKILGENAVALTGVSPSVSAFQLEIASRIAADHDLSHFKIDTSELDSEEYRSNDGSRCYHCKTELYEKISQFRKQTYPDFVIIDGTNADDLSDTRPGMVAADEKGVRSPLALFGFTKEMIRERSKFHGVETWDFPSSPCLASRVQIGVSVSRKRLQLVEKGEEILRNAGFVEFRLRVNENSASIQVDPEEMKTKDFGTSIDAARSKIEKLGFDAVVVDKNGYRMGFATVAAGAD